MDNPRILVVEDEYGVRQFLKRSLERRGYRVLTARDGEEGAILAKVEEPQVILLDLNLPKVSGHKLMKLFKGDPDICAIPVIVITGRNGEADRRLSFSLGAVDHLKKPVALSDLVRKIRAALVQAGEDDEEPPDATDG